MKIITEKIIEEITFKCEICGEIIPSHENYINICEICEREHCNKCHTSSHISKLHNHQDKNKLIGVCSICENINNEYIIKMDEERKYSRLILSEIKLQWKNASNEINSKFESSLKNIILE